MSLGVIAFCDCHYLFESSGNNSLALVRVGTHHGMGFSTTCLPVRKYGAVISIKYIVNQREGTLLINR